MPSAHSSSAFREYRQDCLDSQHKAAPKYETLTPPSVQCEHGWSKHLVLMPEDLETTIVLCSTEVFLAERWLSFSLLQFEKLSFLRGCQDASLKHFILPGSFTVQKHKRINAIYVTFPASCFLFFWSVSQRFYKPEVELNCCNSHRRLKSSH